MMLLAANATNPVLTFWLYSYALFASLLIIYLAVRFLQLGRRNKRLTYEMHHEHIDLAEFYNRNIPLKVSYKGTEPRFLWVTYLSLRNTGNVDITSEDIPDKQPFTLGAPGARYIGFNRLISDKTKVVLNPLFGDDQHEVRCKLEFDRLGPGDEILVSLTFVADERQTVRLEGGIFGGGSELISGYRQRAQAWRSLWWLLIGSTAAGLIGAGIMIVQGLYYRHVLIYQLQILVVMYLLALATAAVLLRPIRHWEQLPARFNPPEAGKRPRGVLATIRFLMGQVEE